MSAVIYSRISDDPRGKAAGVERQTDECHALATARGVRVVETIVDNDISATSGKRRPGYERVLELVRAGAVDTVIVWHTDRLYRLPRDLEPLIDLASGGALRFLTVTASEIDLNTPSGRMVARMLAAASAQEVEHKADRQRSASDQRATRGEPTTRPGYGLRRDGDRVVEVAAEAEILREAAQRVLGGESMRKVAADFEARGVASPSGKPWTGTSVRRALQRPSIAGLRVHRGEIVGEAAGDVILDRDTWERMTALFNDPTRAPKRRGRGPMHLLSGIALCGVCGDGTTVHRHPGWTPKPNSRTRHTVAPAYACKTCNGVRRNQRDVDMLIEETIIARLERDDAANLFARGDDGRVAEVRAAIDATDAKLANAADAFAADSIDMQQLTRITATLHEKRKALEAELRAAMPSSVPAEAVGPQAREAWATFGIETQRAIVRELIDVTILRAGPGRRIFDPETVQIRWKFDVT